MRDWINGDDGPSCNACGRATYITRSVDHWPICVCMHHDVSVLAGGRPIELAGVRPTATPKDPWDAAWYLPKHPPDYIPDEVDYRVPPVVEKYADCSGMTFDQVKAMLLLGKQEYDADKRSTQSIVAKAIDWLFSQ